MFDGIDRRKWKAALEGIFADAVDEYGAQLWTLRGFNSESFAYEWAQEIERFTEEGKRVTVAYYGDFDPSGLAIEADAKAKLERFGAEFEWARHGLLLDDFDRFDLVRVPVKKTDTRSARFLDHFGDCAAELDALHPDELRRRIRACIEREIDGDAWQRLKVAEKAERESLSLVTANWVQAVEGARVAAGGAS